MPPLSGNVNIDIQTGRSVANHLRMLLTTTRFQSIVRVRQMLHGNTCPHPIIGVRYETQLFVFGPQLGATVIVSCPNDDEVVKEFIRVLSTADGSQIQVCQISWDGPSTPIVSWCEVRCLPANATADEVNRAVMTVLTSSHYFKICTMCTERNPEGWMDDNKICMGCATEHFQVVY